MQDNTLVGFLLVNKPKGDTSFHCISHIRKILGKKERIKVGHAGTLDDFAEGLLIIGIGRPATRCITMLMKYQKEYVTTAKLGELTDSLDLTGAIIEQQDTSNITENNLALVIKSMIGNYEQTPPVFSALKYKGKPLYRLARHKKLNQETLDTIVASKKRDVMLHELELMSYKPPFFTLRSLVSKGTYVRSLMDDIAQKLGTRATTYELARTKIGPFSLEQAIPLNQLTSLDDILNHLLPLETVTELLEGQ